MIYNNPVISGFYPDPSICRVENNYYLVTSSFEYFPGVPIFHSFDLVHWRQIGHCLTRDSQLPLKNAGSSKGIYAPTIRYHQGTFYMVTSNVSVNKHFYVTATDPAGEWSEPIWIDQSGIDPSLFFDDDGKAYFTWTNLSGIYQSEIDIQSGELVTEPRVIWTGSGGRYPEAPHLYKFNDTYYLMLAEGGTEYGHMITLARSHSPWGHFESYPNNPILTHRNHGGHPIQGTGHGDVIQAHDGSWWMVFLAFRPVAQFLNYHHLGRETFLAPVTWDGNKWFTVNHQQTISLEMDADCLPPQPWEFHPTRDDFDKPNLGLEWNFLRNPSPNDWSLSARNGWLRLNGSAVTLDDVDSPAFIGRRQQHFNCEVSALLDFSPQHDNEEAGITALMNEAHHYDITITRRDGQRVILVQRRIGDLQTIVAQEPIPDGLITLYIQAEALGFTFAYQTNTFHVLARGASRYLSSEVAGGFTGVYFGMYATGNGTPCTVPADFDWFDYQLR